MADAQRVSLGKRLRQERESRHWTQKELAEKIGKSVPSIDRWEHGRVDLQPDALNRLAEVFGKPPERWGTSRQVPFNVPFSRNPYFTGRELILQRLHQTLAAEQTVALIQTRAISGLGGIGKTQTAIEYAYRYADEYEAVLWIRADSESLVSDYTALATVLDLPVRQERDQHYVVSMVKRWLEKHGPWLLIFDNADDLKLVSDFLPKRAGGAILLTTRSQATGPDIKKIEIGKLSREEGIDFLLHRVHSDEEQRPSTESNQQEREEAEQLWEFMDGLPLALDQAAAYIEETGCTLSDYLKLFKTHSQHLLRLRGPITTAHPESLATTWLLAFEKVKRASPAAAELLRLCAFLHSDEIFETMIIEGASALGPVLQSIAADKLEWNKAIGELRKYSMVKRDAEKKILNMHRLMQAVIKDDLDPTQARQCAASAVRLANNAFPDGEFANWERCEQLVPHALVCANHIKDHQLVSAEAAHLLHQVGEYFYWRARYREGLALSQQALAIRKQVLPPNHPDMAESLNNVAFGYTEQGRYAEALPLYQPALEIWEQALGPNHSLVATGLSNLAEVYRTQGRYAEALPLYQRALAIEEQAHGSNSPQVAISLNNIALLYQATGQATEALQYFQQALSIWEQALGPNHPLVVTGLNNLGGLYLEQGHYAEARLHLQRALAIEEQELGPNDPSVAQSLNHLGGLYRAQGLYTEALPRLKQALAIREEAYGPNHKVVAQSLVNLAELYQDQKQYAEALPLYLQALAIWEQALGPNHPETAGAMHGLARLREAQGNLEEARTWYARALAVRELTLGAQHPKSCNTRECLCAVLIALGKDEVAQPEETKPTETESDREA